MKDSRVSQTWFTLYVEGVKNKISVYAEYPLNEQLPETIEEVERITFLDFDRITLFKVIRVERVVTYTTVTEYKELNDD